MTDENLVGAVSRFLSDAETLDSLSEGPYPKLKSFVALREMVGDYRSRSATPEPETCEPPDEHRHLQWHWLSRADAESPWPWQWLGGRPYWENTCGDVLEPDDVASHGWRYFAPCIPPSPDTNPVSKDSLHTERGDTSAEQAGVSDTDDLEALLHRFWRMGRLEGADYASFCRAREEVLARFKSPPIREVSDGDILEEWARIYSDSTLTPQIAAIHLVRAIIDKVTK